MPRRSLVLELDHVRHCQVERGTERLYCAEVWSAPTVAHISHGLWIDVCDPGELASRPCPQNTSAFDPVHVDGPAAGRLTGAHCWSSVGPIRQRPGPIRTTRPARAWMLSSVALPTSSPAGKTASL